MPVFKKNYSLVGQLGSGPHLVADRADVVPANRFDGRCWLTDSADVVFTHAPRARHRNRRYFCEMLEQMLVQDFCVLQLLYRIFPYIKLNYL